MRVKFKCISAGPKGVIRIGDVVEVSNSEAKLLINGGYAEAVDAPKKAEEVKAVEVKPEQPKKKTKK